MLRPPFLVGRGDEVATGQIPFTERAKGVLEHALSEAIAIGHNYIGAEHILLGLTREPTGVGARILLALGVDAARRSVRRPSCARRPGSGSVPASRAVSAGARRTGECARGEKRTPNRRAIRG